MKKKAVNKSTVFYNIFIGEFVEVLTDVSAERIENDEVGSSTIKIPLVLYGYVLEIDDEYIYLGKSPHEIFEALPRSRISHICISEETAMEFIQVGSDVDIKDFN